MVATLLSRPSGIDAALFASHVPKPQQPYLQVSPRIARALMELQVAESMLAKSRANTNATVQPSDWLTNKLLSTTSSMALASQVRTPSPFHVASKQSFPSTSSQGRPTTAATPPSMEPLMKPAEYSNCQPTNKPSSTPTSVPSSPSTNAPHMPESTPSSTFDLRPVDILCGRGGKSNHHIGNKRFRKVVSQMKESYKNIGTKAAKTELSRAIVEHVYQYGGRFVKFDSRTRKYVTMSTVDARKKTSQALREAKDVKWTL